MNKRKKSIGKRIMHGILFCVIAAVCCFGLALGALCYAQAHAEQSAGTSDALIVLGAQVYSSGELSPQLALRMEAAWAAYQKYPRMIVVCGGQGGNEPLPEGEAMRAWLLEKGVPNDQVIAETTSMNTLQNLQNAIALLPASAQRITIVTSDYHLPRALQIARDLGVEADGIGSPCKPEYWMKNHTREVLAWGKYFLNRITGQ